MNGRPPSRSHRSPVLAILAALVAGAALAVALPLSLTSGGPEPVVTGPVLFAFGPGWGLLAFVSTRLSAQPQAWAAVPASSLGCIATLGVLASIRAGTALR